ncbi:hypothetical protein, partial [Serratia marcescens]|uniref:hypothetical protein n=1 Tax=Serratia marcescens TaxID=615 RepID=UPI001CA34FEE
LKEEHNITEENVVVVEKSNTYKFTINSIKALFQFSSRIIIIILTIIGLMGIIYPSPRTAIFTIIYEAVQQLQDYLGPLITAVQNLSKAA